MTFADSPALKLRRDCYPARFKGRVPRRVKVLRIVRPDIGLMPIAMPGTIYEAWTNSLGAVCAIFPSGETLGLKPDEFEVVEWHYTDTELLDAWEKSDGWLIGRTSTAGWQAACQRKGMIGEAVIGGTLRDVLSQVLRVEAKLSEYADPNRPPTPAEEVAEAHRKANKPFGW